MIRVIRFRLVPSSWVSIKPLHMTGAPKPKAEVFVAPRFEAPPGHRVWGRP